MTPASFACAMTPAWRRAAGVVHTVREHDHDATRGLSVARHGIDATRQTVPHRGALMLEKSLAKERPGAVARARRLWGAPWGRAGPGEAGRVDPVARAEAGVPAITCDRNCESTSGRLEKRGAIQGSASKPPMVARSPGSNRPTNSVTARRVVTKLSTMLKLISTMIATANGTTSLRNAVISHTYRCHGLRSRLSSGSVTRRPLLVDDAGGDPDPVGARS